MKRVGIKRPPVPYIPPVDSILDAAESKLGTKNYKVSLPNGTIVYHTVYNIGLNKAFMIHVQEVMNFCKQKGFYKSYEIAKTNFVDCTTRFNNAQKTLDDANADPTTSTDRKHALKKSLELATTGKSFFSLTRRS